MKNLLLGTLLALGSAFIGISCEDPDPCESIICDTDLDDNNICVDGSCACETNNWSYLTWEFDCANCPATLPELIIDVEVNGVKIKSLSLPSFDGHSNRFFVERLTNVNGAVPYRITSGTMVLEEGFLNLIQCQALVTNSILSI